MPPPRPPQVMGAALRPIVLLCASLLLGAASSQPVLFSVTNELAGQPLGDLFDTEFGEVFTLELMNKTTFKVCEILDIRYPSLYKSEVKFFVKKDLPNAIGQAYSNVIEFDMQKFADIVDPRERWSWFEAVMYHEMTHVWQLWSLTSSPDDDTSFSKQIGIKEGTAEFVVMNATTFTNPNCVGWKPSLQERWYAGYCRTAYFFRYLTTLRPTFVAELDRDQWQVAYREDVFRRLLHKTPDQLWSDFVKNHTPNPLAVKARASDASATLRSFLL